MTSSEVQKLEILITALKVAVELEHKNTREKLEDLNSSLKLKADKWVEVVMKRTLGAVLFSVLAAILGLVIVSGPSLLAYAIYNQIA